MTGEGFRALALAMPGAVEKSHLGTPDFRVNNRIFASGGVATGRPVLKFQREEQEMLMAAEPDVFIPASGRWGLQGWTHIALSHADETLVRDALARSYANVTAKRRR